jgi:hypothetical protein
VARPWVAIEEERMTQGTSIWFRLGYIKD